MHISTLSKSDVHFLAALTFAITILITLGSSSTLDNGDYFIVASPKLLSTINAQQSAFRKTENLLWTTASGNTEDDFRNKDQAHDKKFHVALQ